MSIDTITINDKMDISILIVMTVADGYWYMTEM